MQLLQHSNIVVSINFCTIFLKLIDLLIKPKRYLFSFMQEVAEKIIIPPLICTKQNKASMVCINPLCSKPGIVCQIKECKECRSNHGFCPMFWIDNLVSFITKKRKNMEPSLLKAYQEMNKIYEEAIQRLSKDKASLMDSVQYYGLNEKQAQFCRMAVGNDLENIIGANMNEVVKNMNKEILFVATQQMIQRFWKIRKQRFDKIFDGLKQLRTVKGELIDSKITNENSMITNFFESPFYKATLIFRASEHSFSANAFHKKCDNVKNTLVIAKSQYGNIFGGFSPLQWSSNGTYKQDSKLQTFIFSITKARKYLLKDPQYAIYGNSSYGPTFGGGHDIHISDQCDTSSGSYFNTGHSYNLSEYGVSYGYQDAYEQLSGSRSGYNAKVVEYEVFQLEF